MDLNLFIFAGFDTTSRTINVTLYHLKKNPKVLEKLMNEIRKHKLDRTGEMSDLELRDALQNCDYLNYVVKESLRIDTPGPITLGYVAYEEVTICDVIIPKGQNILMGTVYSHFNPKHWHRPTEYLPERFDPESELFYKPGTKEMRHPKSFNSFSCGKRKCIGQVLGLLSAKVILVEILTKLNFDISQELMDREMPSFNLYSETELFIKIK